MLDKVVVVEGVVVGVGGGGGHKMATLRLSLPAKAAALSHANEAWPLMRSLGAQ